MERINKLYIIVGLVITCGLFFAIASFADETDQATTITFSTPVEVPGRLLPAGSYLFKIPDGDSGPNLVQIFHANGKKLYGTFETVPAERLEPADHTIVTLADQGSEKPAALMTWFYPGLLTGNEFVYPSRQEKELARICSARYWSVQSQLTRRSKLASEFVAGVRSLRRIRITTQIAGGAPAFT